MFNTGDVLKLKKPISHDAEWRYRVVFSTGTQVVIQFYIPGEYDENYQLYLYTQWNLSKIMERE